MRTSLAGSHAREAEVKKSASATTTTRASRTAQHSHNTSDDDDDRATAFHRCATTTTTTARYAHMRLCAYVFVQNQYQQHARIRRLCSLRCALARTRT